MHPKFFRSINEIFNKLLFKTWRNNWLTPQFWLGGLKRVPIWANLIVQCRTRQAVFLQLLDIPFLCYKPHWLLVSHFPCPMASNAILIEFYFQTSWGSNSSSLSTCPPPCIEKRKSQCRTSNDVLFM
jgi:hypothetical protein